MSKATWEDLISDELHGCGESWDDVVANTMSFEDMSKVFDDGYGSSSGCSFTVWTKKRVYFPVVYDGAEWVGSVSRNPDGVATSHVGGQ